MELPLDIQKIISCLAQANHEAFVVGGCVRDFLQNKRPKDWDITTSATPTQMRAALKNYKLVPTGEQYGTLTVVVNSESYELTTYRADGNYTDGRRPDSVLFSKHLKEDLKRRDFTINAMAYNTETGLVDLFGGFLDLQNKIIRCVGNPNDRFKEDALRIMRAVRFACHLNFSIAKETQQAIFENGEKLKNVSQERITAELITILKKRNKNIRPVIEYIIKTTISQDIHAKVIDALFTIKTEDIEILLAIIFSNIENPKDILFQKKLDNKTINNTCVLIENRYTQMLATKPAAKHMLKNFGHDICLKLLQIRQLDLGDTKNDISQLETIWQQIMQNNEPYKISHLNISGTDIMAMGIPQGKHIGQILEHCLNVVIDNPSKNTKPHLHKEVLCIKESLRI